MDNTKAVKIAIAIMRNIKKENILSYKKVLLLNLDNIISEIVATKLQLLRMLNTTNKLNGSIQISQAADYSLISGKSEIVTKFNSEISNYLDDCEGLRSSLQNTLSLDLKRGDAGVDIASLGTLSSITDYSSLMLHLNDMSSIVKDGIDFITSSKNNVDTLQNTLNKMYKLNKLKAGILSSKLGIKTTIVENLAVIDMCLYVYNNYTSDYATLSDMLNQSETIIGGWLNDKGVTINSLMQPYSSVE